MTIEVPSFLITIHNTHASLVSAYDLSYFVCNRFCHSYLVAFAAIS